jgi:lipopolysaccharide/colanic/teichoic acid biosynthesis glycosyltransferase
MVGAIGCLAILAPVMAVVGILLAVTLGRPVLFRQRRPGFATQPFTLLKFRTMLDATDGGGHPLPDSSRLTRFGRFLRRTSLDELPSLWNVVRGEMSLVGPRPLLDRYLPYYSERERRRFDTLPGLTGWSQIHGRNLSSWDRRLELDVWYVEHRSFWLDATILMKTPWQILRGSGVVVDPGSVMCDLDVERRAR